MYLSYYGLKEKPFDISTDPRFLWLGEKHKEALAVLKYGVLENKGFLLLTGDVGAGKTTLIHALIEGFGNEVIYATIPDPGLNLMEFYTYLARAFNIEEPFKNKSDFIFVFREFLHNAYEKGKQVLIIIDEAQRLSNNLLEEIRLLSNIELQNVKLLNIFFVGQVEFNTRLLEPENRAVRQRITISNHIRPLTEKETGEYIRHRLRVAGCQKNIFSFVAIHEIYKFSGGYPRLINIVCDLSMVSGYVKEIKKIGEDIVKESIDSLNLETSTAKNDPEPPTPEYTPLKDDFDTNFQIRDVDGTAHAHARSEPVVIKQSGLPGAAIIYICILLVIAIGYLMYSQHSLDRFKKWVTPSKNNQHEEHLLAPSIPAPAKPVPAIPGKTAGNVKAVPVPEPEKPPFTAMDDDNQQRIYPLAETGKDTAVVKETPQKETTPPGVSGPMAKRDETGPADLSFDKDRIIIDFKHNSNEFSDDAYRVLEKLSRFLIMNPEVRVMVEGYSDSMGVPSYNQTLSSFRANIVKSYLVGKGIAVSRIHATGLGSENPRASNATPEGRRMNRRVEIEIVNQRP